MAISQKTYGTGDVFTISAIKLYWIDLINNGISFYYFLALFLTISIWIISARFSKTRKEDNHIQSMHYIFLFIWLIVPFIIFTFAVNKDYRYILPILPALAIFGGIAFYRLASNKYRLISPFLLLIFPLLNYFYVSFEIPAVIGYYKWGPFILLGEGLGYAHSPRKQLWPNLQLSDLIQRDIEGGDAVRDKVVVTLLFDHPYMNQLTLAYYATNQKNITFETVDYLQEGYD